MECSARNRCEACFSTRFACSTKCAEPCDADVRPADSVSSSVIRSRVRSIRLIVLMARTLAAFVSTAGAAMKVRTANGDWPNDVVTITADGGVRLPAAQGRTSLSGNQHLKLRRADGVFLRMIWIGTSGFQYPEWKPEFYPAKLPAAKMLAFYADRFCTTEINYTFRELPSDKAISNWLAQTPSKF